MERCIENMQLNNRTKIANVDLKKREICVSTEKAVQEIKTFVDDAYAGWIKRFEQTHEDSVRILKVVYDELKRFSTIVHETKVLLQSVLEKGYSKQLFITKQIQFARIVDHINRMKARDFCKGLSVVSFLSSSSKSDFHACIKGGRLVVVDRYYQQIFQSEKFHQSSPHGLTIDLQDNICVCCRTTKGGKRKQFSFFNFTIFFNS